VPRQEPSLSSVQEIAVQHEEEALVAAVGAPRRSPLEIEARAVRAGPGASPGVVLLMEDEATDIAAVILRKVVRGCLMPARYK
jgi:hypothetical protein